MNKTATININDQPRFRLCVGCLICDESVLLTEQEEMRIKYGHPIHSKVCDQCRAAILYMREQMPLTQEKEN